MSKAACISTPRPMRLETSHGFPTLRGVTGVTIGTQVGFAGIGQQEKIVATGYCVE